MAHYLITGGAGFIGSRLAHALVARGDRVRILDNFATGRRENLAGLEERLEIVEGSGDDPAAFKREEGGNEYVLHQAAPPSVQRSVEFPLESHSTNQNRTP